MRKVSEYEQHADECRAMAVKTRNPVHRKQLEDMANTWAMLARERRRQVLKQADSDPPQAAFDGRWSEIAPET